MDDLFIDLFPLGLFPLRVGSLLLAIDLHYVVHDVEVIVDGISPSENVLSRHRLLRVTPRGNRILIRLLLFKEVISLGRLWRVVVLCSCAWSIVVGYVLL